MSEGTEDFERELMSIAAHDLKTPISATKGFIELIQQTGPLNDNQQRFADRALQSLLRMEMLVADLLEFSRLDSTTSIKRERCNLRRCVQQAIDTYEHLAEDRGIDVHVSIEDGADTVSGDERLLERVLSNLVGNAVKYNQDQGEVWITLYRKADMVQCDIRDSGLGIPDADVPRVFERFFRSRTHDRDHIEGNGLGLAIVAMIVQKHGGQIWVESQLNEGSTFSFVLPAPSPGRRLDAFSGGQSSDGVDDRMQDSPEHLEIDSPNEEV